MNRYHMNPKTGNPNKCSAKLGKCPFKTDAGDEATHYASPDEARSGYEHEMDEKAEQLRLAKAAAAELDWPTPNEKAIAEAEAAGYNVDIKSKLLSLQGRKDNYRWEISVRKGVLHASKSMNGSLGTALRLTSDWPAEEKDAITRYAEFSDYGTELSVEEAEEHVKDMERVLVDSPNFINRANDALVAAEKLYGLPKKQYYSNMYAKVDALPAIIPTRAGAPKAFRESGEGYFHHMTTEESNRLTERSDSSPSSYTGIQGEAITRISLFSTSNLDQAGYQERIGNLKDSIATAVEMQKALAKHPLPPQL